MFVGHIIATLYVSAGLVCAQRAAVTGEANVGRRPWYLNQFSAEFVDGAIQIRHTGVPEAEASSVAKHIVDDGLAPTQYTEMASMAMRWVERGNVPATSLSEVASIFASAYTSLHTQLEYSSFVGYVRSHTSIYDLNKLPIVPPQQLSLETSSSNKGSGPEAEGPRLLQSLYQSIIADPTGRAALATFSKVLDQYQRDLGFMTPQSLFSVNPIVEFIYNFII